MSALALRVIAAKLVSPVNVIASLPRIIVPHVY